MITGFNTDVEYNGTVYHVQTEDRGLKNPIIETLVYTGGRIIACRKSPYADLVASGCHSEDALMKRMEAQHKELMHEIREGKFSEEERRKPFGHSIVSNRSFDQVVLGFLDESMEAGSVRIDMLSEPMLKGGEKRAIRVRVQDEATGGPVVDATVVARVVGRKQGPRELGSTVTDEEGVAELTVELPDLAGQDATLLCQADVAGRTASLRRRIRRSQSVSAS